MARHSISQATEVTLLRIQILFLLSKFMMQGVSKLCTQCIIWANVPVIDNQQGQPLLLLEDHDFSMVDPPTYRAAAATHAESQPSGNL